MGPLTQIGSIAGLASAIFLVWDRFMAGQPIVWLTRKPHLAPPIRFLRCMNVSKWDILIRKIKVFPNVVFVAPDDTAETVTDAHDLNLPFQALIPAGETIDFTLGERAEAGRFARWIGKSSFLIIVSWRSTRSPCLPKAAVFHPSSLRTLRAIDQAKLSR
jgi:hypothetical protein